MNPTKPISFAVVLTDEEGTQLLKLLDAAVRSLGLPCVDSVSVIHRKIQHSYIAAKQAGEITPTTIKVGEK